MAIVFAETRKLPNMRSFRIVGNLTFSGNYVTGGEVPTGLIRVLDGKGRTRCDLLQQGRP